jgi:WD40 repeat protein
LLIQIDENYVIVGIHNRTVNAMMILPNDDVVSSSDETIKIWNTTDGVIKQTLSGKGQLIK